MFCNCGMLMNYFLICAQASQFHVPVDIPAISLSTEDARLL
jgi:hypothetical protein